MTERARGIDQICFRRHMLLGWWSLLLFISLGAVLESLHGFKIGWYLDVDSEVRRLMWRLAHAHGALVALVHIAFAVTALTVPAVNPNRRRLASACLVGAGVLLPAGFFLGGVVIYPGDPGPAILLVPIGAALLFAAVLLTARGVGARLTDLAKAREAAGVGGSE